MTAEENQIDAHAHRLFYARRDGISTDLVTASSPDITPEQAQQIASKTLAAYGSASCGYKLGYTSEAMRRQMNIDRPNFGRLTADMDFGKGVNAKLIHPRAEPEIALRIARDVTAAPRTLKELLTFVDAVLPALEIVDTRYHDYVFRYEDNIADNSSAAGFVLGASHRPQLLDEEGFAVGLTTNGEELTGHSSAAMGGPLEALQWLCEELEGAGETLPAGSIVLTGGLTSAPFLTKGEPVTGHFGALGTLTFAW